MWLIIGLITCCVLFFFTYWLEKRDRKFAESRVDDLRINQDELLGKLHQSGLQDQPLKPPCSSWAPEMPYHKFLYHDGGRDLWLGERNTSSYGWQLCILALTQKGVIRSADGVRITNNYQPVNRMENLRELEPSSKLVEAYDYAKKKGLLPRYDKPYAVEHAKHFFLGQFYGVDLWHIETTSGTFTRRIAFCYPSTLNNRPTLKGFKGIDSFYGWNASSPAAAALQVGYDLAAERGLVPKIDHG